MRDARLAVGEEPRLFIGPCIAPMVSGRPWLQGAPRAEFAIAAASACGVSNARRLGLDTNLVPMLAH